MEFRQQEQTGISPGNIRQTKLQHTVRQVWPQLEIAKVVSRYSTDTSCGEVIISVHFFWLLQRFFPNWMQLKTASDRKAMIWYRGTMCGPIWPHLEDDNTKQRINLWHYADLQCFSLLSISSFAQISCIAQRCLEATIMLWMETLHCVADCHVVVKGQYKAYWLRSLSAPSAVPKTKKTVKHGKANQNPLLEITKRAGHCQDNSLWLQRNTC